VGERTAGAHRDERSFGLTVGAVLALLGGWWLVRGRFPVLAPALFAAGLLLAAAGAVFPRALVLPRRGWMALAEALSAVTSQVVLLLVFALVVTPLGLLRRLLGADPLRRRASLAGSAWHPYPRRHLDPRHYEKTF